MLGLDCLEKTANTHKTTQNDDVSNLRVHTVGNVTPTRDIDHVQRCWETCRCCYLLVT